MALLGGDRLYVFLFLILPAVLFVALLISAFPWLITAESPSDECGESPWIGGCNAVFEISEIEHNGPECLEFSENSCVRGLNLRNSCEGNVTVEGLEQVFSSPDNLTVGQDEERWMSHRGSVGNESFNLSYTISRRCPK